MNSRWHDSETTINTVSSLNIREQSPCPLDDVARFSSKKRQDADFSFEDEELDEE